MLINVLFNKVLLCRTDIKNISMLPCSHACQNLGKKKYLPQ